MSTARGGSATPRGMAWLVLIVAGLLEAGWAIGLKYTQGFTKLVPSVLTIAAIVGSMWMLAWCAKTLPIGTAYAVWVGIGATGAAVLGVALLGEPLSWGRGFFMALMLASIVGLKLTTPTTPTTPTTSSASTPSSSATGPTR